MVAEQVVNRKDEEPLVVFWYKMTGKMGESRSENRVQIFQLALNICHIGLELWSIVSTGLWFIVIACLPFTFANLLSSITRTCTNDERPEHEVRVTNYYF